MTTLTTTEAANLADALSTTLADDEADLLALVGLDELATRLFTNDQGDDEGSTLAVILAVNAECGSPLESQHVAALVSLGVGESTFLEFVSFTRTV